jgi:hypothetical protein
MHLERKPRMGRRTRPDFSYLRKPPVDASQRGVCVASPGDVGDVVRVARARLLGKQVDAAPRLGVSVGMLSGLERGDGGSQLNHTLGVLTDLGFDVVLVPRDPARSLQDNDTRPTP